MLKDLLKLVKSDSPLHSMSEEELSSFKSGIVLESNNKEEVYLILGETAKDVFIQLTGLIFFEKASMTWKLKEESGLCEDYTLPDLGEINFFTSESDSEVKEALNVFGNSEYVDVI